MTPRQKEIVFLLAKGCSLKEIAIELDIRRNTVNDHILKLMRASSFRSREQMMWELSKLEREKGGRS